MEGLFLELGIVLLIVTAAVAETLACVHESFLLSQVGGCAFFLAGDVLAHVDLLLCNVFKLGSSISGAAFLAFINFLALGVYIETVLVAVVHGRFLSD